MSHVFLSDPWFDAVTELQTEQPAPPEALVGVVVQINVTNGPDGDCSFHMDSNSIFRGPVENPPTTLTVPYDTAKALFVEGNPQAAMQAFMSGKIKVDGDMTKLMSMQAGAPSDEQMAYQEKLQDITV